jgi:hypothetical protein
MIGRSKKQYITSKKVLKIKPTGISPAIIIQNFKNISRSNHLFLWFNLLD